MKLILLIIALALASASGFAQQLHFAYLQTDTHQPFYVTLNQKNYSSSSTGYIILPKLQNGDYPLRIGFAKNAETEQEYLLQVKENDQGFLIKDFGDKGWGLFNLQTMAVQYAGAAAQERAKILAAQKAEAEQRQRKLDEEAQAIAAQRRADSLKIVAIAQQAYTDSVAAVTAATRRRVYEDSVLQATNAALQASHADSVANAKAMIEEARWKKKTADSLAKAQEAAIGKQKTEAANATEKAAANEAKRLKQMEDATAREQAVAAKKQKQEQAAAEATEKAVAKENERLEKIADSTARAQAAALEKQKLKEEAAEAKALAKEKERLERIAEATAKAQAAELEKQKSREEAAAKKTKAAEATVPAENVAIKKTETTKAVQPPVMIQQTFTDSGWHYAYNITNNNQRETVGVFIPSAQPKLPVSAVVMEEKAATPPPEIKEVTLAATEKKDSIKFLDINVGFDTTATPADPVLKDSVAANPAIREAENNQPIIAGNAGNQTAVKDSTTATAEKSILNANCKAVANEKDFLTARKKMAAVFGTDAMLAAARKLLKEKCYTTEQLRNLCVLFLSDEGRYQFLDAAYPYAFDAYRYGTLQDLLLDDYYLQRFKTMLRQP